jgi:hypothetical protein
MEEYRLRKFKNGIHRITFEFRGEEVTSSWRELERNGRYDIHSRNIFTMIMSRQMIRAGHMPLMWRVCCISCRKEST